MSKKILVVEDRDTHLMIIADRLRLEGYEVVTATNAEEARKRVEEQEIDLITLDLIMPPKEDGLAERKVGENLLYFLKHNDNTKSIPIIVITIYGRDGEVVNKCCDSGADRVIQKPFDIDDVVKIVKEVTTKGKAI